MRNGEPFQMDEAPYAENNRTYIPIRYIAECFGQSVEWNGGQQHVVIQEDKSVAGDSNLEAWAWPWVRCSTMKITPRRRTFSAASALWRQPRGGRGIQPAGDHRARLWPAYSGR